MQCIQSVINMYILLQVKNKMIYFVFQPWQGQIVKPKIIYLKINSFEKL